MYKVKRPRESFQRAPCVPVNQTGPRTDTPRAARCNMKKFNSLDQSVKRNRATTGTPETLPFQIPLSGRGFLSVAPELAEPIGWDDVDYTTADLTRAVLRNHSMPPYPRLVLLYLIDKADPLGLSWYSQATMAADLCVATRTIIRAVRWLELSDYIEKVRRPNTSNRYQVNIRKCQRVTSGSDLESHKEEHKKKNSIDRGTKSPRQNEIFIHGGRDSATEEKSA